MFYLCNGGSLDSIMEDLYFSNGIYTSVSDSITADTSTTKSTVTLNKFFPLVLESDGSTYYLAAINWSLKSAPRTGITVGGSYSRISLNAYNASSNLRNIDLSGYTTECQTHNSNMYQTFEHKGMGYLVLGKNLPSGTTQIRAHCEITNANVIAGGSYVKVYGRYIKNS